MIFLVSVWYAEPSFTLPGDLCPELPPVLAPPPPPEGLAPPPPPVAFLRLSFLPARMTSSPRLDDLAEEGPTATDFDNTADEERHAKEAAAGRTAATEETRRDAVAARAGLATDAHAQTEAIVDIGERARASRARGREFAPMT